MITRPVEFADLLDAIGAGSELTYRLVAQQDGHEWKAHTLLLDRLPTLALARRPQETRLPEMTYDRIFFASGTVDAETVISWLREHSIEWRPAGRSGPVRRCVLPVTTNKVSWSRAESYALSDYTQAPIPLNRYDATSTTPSFISLPYIDGFLLADGLPFYPDVKTAILRYAYGVINSERIHQASLDPRIIVRLADMTAWLSHITLSPTAAVVHVAGDHVHGTQLTISSADGAQFQQQLEQPGDFECLLPNGLPNPLWIVVSRGNNWIDYYHRDDRSPFTRRAQDNVTVDLGDPSVEIAAVIAGGEGLTTEFKADIPRERDQMLKTIAAFANGVGGVLLLGVKDKTGELVGYSGDIDTIINMIRDNVFPDPLPRIEVVEIEKRRVLAIYIEKGAAPPYGLHPTRTHYYVRRGATTFPARPEELRAIVLASQQPVTGPFAGYVI